MIIVAGGKGKRMHSNTPKQFLNVAGRPILMHTIQKFHRFSDGLKIILVLPEPFIDFWKSLCKRYEFNLDHELVVGGDTRYQSVYNGLKCVEKDSLVAIHDGVRPLVAEKTIEQTFKTAEEAGTAIPVVKINESVRKLDKDESNPVNRKSFRLVQTPQCFRSEIILKAYLQDYDESFTDDATVVEELGIQLKLVEGNYENIKITRPVDLKIASALLK